jgi:hypothetical protein
MTAAARAPLLAVVCAVLLAACAGPTVPSSPANPASPAAAASTGPSPASTPSAEPEPTPTDAGAAALAAVPTACYGIGEEDCRLVLEHVASLLTAGDAPVRYIQVGPFGCPAVQGCPRTLAARPEGDVMLELDGGALSFHVAMRNGALDAERQEFFGVDLPPTSQAPLPGAPQPYTLGHCGLWSGVDFGGSWWDPIGFVDSDHGDSINAAEGTIVLVGPDRALFTSKAGLAVQLARHAGEKSLPFCD